MNLVERLPNEAFRVTRKLPYVDVFSLLPIYEKVAFRSNLVLVGPKGIGKSMSVAHYAVENKRHLVTFDCSEDVRRSHLIGTYTMRGHETPFVLGPIPTAYEVANDTGFCILCLEEINALSPQMQKVLNSSTDFRRRVEVPEAQRVFELKQGAQLWVVGTMNTAVYGGVYALNEDLKSRFRMVPLDYPQSEADIIASEMRDRRIVVDASIVKKVLTLAAETRQKSVEYALSPRDVVQIIEDISLIGVKDALWIASGKFDDADRKFFQDRVWDNFDNMLLPGATAPAQTRPKVPPGQAPARP
jgi:MoxR-like ATPase